MEPEFLPVHNVAQDAVELSEIVQNSFHIFFVYL